MATDGQPMASLALIQYLNELAGERGAERIRLTGGSTQRNR
ncbi:MAG: hypothetical protein NZ556_02380 [Fimbriimonadales bacterium]|nr:hypothetical protein [Fimbriimonadales bacterium]